ncbi:MAG: penicillin-binding protein [Solirubrobacteraceae bacterium]|jgi:cell division protein FtsI/penicillin-binding protein 2|nr:penicillin-binding protein [Solirubrobacteraceae bacterium]
MEAGSTSYDEPRAERPPREQNRRYRLTHHLGPVAILAGVAFLAGAVVGALYVPAERDTANRFARAWAQGNYDAMYAELSGAARSRTSAQSFREAYAQAAATATATSIAVGGAKDPKDGVVEVPVRVATRVFGTVRGTLRLPFTGDGKDARVDWRPDLTFPGVPRGAQLTRDTRLPRRATLLARNGRALAKGDDRSTSLTVVAAETVGQLGPIPPEDRFALRAQGYPDDAQVGISGLERALQPRLAGRPGGTLSAGGRVLARSQPRPARPVTSTIDPRLEEATISALGGQSGGVAVLEPATGEVLALAGTAFSATGPPGSTFKVITTTAALEDHKVKLKDKFPVETAAVLSGVRLANANSESCGGTFEESFAHSCNSVFAPLGVKVGKARLVEEAQAYGWNEAPAIPGAMAASIPPPSGIGDDLDIGSTAIGQGKVLASPLQMASVAATVGNRGVRVVPTVERGHRSRRVKVTTPALAATLRKLMIGVVKYGTGTAADIPGVQVAGKTGTAELGLPANQTDAWFIAFAPARRPKVALAVWRLRAGAGGQISAPIARQVLAAALGR